MRNSENPYSPPVSESVVPIAPVNALPLADRNARLIAYILDCFLVGVIAAVGLIALFASGIIPGIPSPQQRPIWLAPLISLASFLLFALVHAPSLKKSGQTIGKKAGSLRIVTLAGEKPSLGNLLFRRYAFLFLIGSIPVIGSILSLINALMIFGRERRCLHDLVAGTKVISEILPTSEAESGQSSGHQRDRSRDAEIVTMLFQRKLSLDWSGVNPDADLVKDLRIPRSELYGFFEAVGDALNIEDIEGLEQARTRSEISKCLGIPV